MSIQSEITRISGNITDSLAAVEDMGGTVPSGATSNNLAAAIRTIAGSGGEAFAVISVTYPEGSVCTCSSGTKTLKAKGTSGTWLFLLPFSGTWTLTATKDGQTTSTNVTIMNYGEVKNVDLSFALYIVKDGVNVGGLQAFGNGMITPNAGYLTTRTTGNNTGGSRVNIDVTPYKTLYITVRSANNYISSGSQGGNLGLGVTTPYVSSDWQGFFGGISTYKYINDGGSYSIPVENLTGSLWISLLCVGTSGGFGYINVTNMYLE